MILLIDDIRSIQADIVARNHTAAKLLLENFTFTEILFDHDLGGPFTGYDLMKWMYANDIEFPPKITLVTSNPIGLKNMENLIMNDLKGYKKVDRITFKRETSW